jgi:hypothetical protein
MGHFCSDRAFRSEQKFKGITLAKLTPSTMLVFAGQKEFAGQNEILHELFSFYSNVVVTQEVHKTKRLALCENEITTDAIQRVLPNF